MDAEVLKLSSHKEIGDTMMKRASRFLIWLALVGLVVPQVSATDLRPLAAAHSARQASISDVMLTANHSLQGQLVNRDGIAKPGTQLTVSSAGQVVAKTISDERGFFAVQLDKGGIYTLSDGNQAAVVRVWTNDTAPPSAKQAVLMVSDGQLSRAKGGMGGMGGSMMGGNLGLMVGLAAVAGVTAAVIIAAADDAS
jgi:hypothetical protein